MFIFLTDLLGSFLLTSLLYISLESDNNKDSETIFDIVYDN